MRVTGTSFYGVVLVVLSGCVGDSSTTDGGTDATTDVAIDVPVSNDGGDASDAADGGCGDTQSSPSNCGKCGHQCKSGDTCAKGVCGYTVTQIAGSPSSADQCLVLANGTVYCWGDNSHGECGTGDALPRSSATLVKLDNTGATFDHVVEVGVGFTHTCARKDDGSIWCWGLGQNGETGVAVGSSVADLLKPAKVGTLTGYTAIRSGSFSNCGIDASGKVQCFGANEHLLLGHPNMQSGDTAFGTGCNGGLNGQTVYCNAAPTVVAGISGVTELMMSDQYACAVDSAGAVKCWGADDYDQLGDNPQQLFPCAKALMGVTVPVSPISLGGSRNEVCVAYGNTADAQCWGYNKEGELGIGTGTSSGPVAYGGGSVKLLATSGGVYHLCALKTDGHVLCAGANDNHQLGNGGPSSQTPQSVLIGTTPIDNITQLASGYFQTCAVRSSDNTVWCWGDNVAGPGGRLGDGTKTARVGAVQVVGLP